MRIITLEGERYILTLPSRYMAEALTEYIDPTLTGYTASQNMFVIQKNIDEKNNEIMDIVITYPLSSNKEAKSEICTTYREAQGSLNQKRAYAKRIMKRHIAVFCLIPLNKHGGIDRFMRFANPDGTMAEFGELLIDGSPQKRTLLHIGNKGTHIEIRDCETPGNELQWVWIDGKLVCCTCCLQTSAGHLIEEGLLAAAAPMGKKMTEDQMYEWLSTFSKSDFR